MGNSTSFTAAKPSFEAGLASVVSNVAISVGQVDDAGDALFAVVLPLEFTVPAGSVDPGGETTLTNSILLELSLLLGCTLPDCTLEFAGDALWTRRRLQTQLQTVKTTLRITLN